MSEEQSGAALPSEEHHEGGFRPTLTDIVEAQRSADTSRGGPHLGPLVEQIRTLMDRARLLSPSDDLALEAIAALEKLNDRLTEGVVEEWAAPAWSRHDLPARGNVTLPPYTLEKVHRDGVLSSVTFRTFHLGGNAAAHGGHIALAFDDLMGMAAAVRAGAVTRTASLTVDYRAITPLDKPLALRSWAERQEGRKVFVRATLHDGETLCAEANGLFIVLKVGQQ
ncbi:PaaI family thioesterase [Nocardia bovistercoris]|uniref:Acyl-coenzyme A thioesterase THEM4 n=1 Tax=Nocardia bovistercoris TaxID=2785916 RepID=A0A931I850_9NOCA|nr:PaaI family thioesterase [Nocardia bovistercoris]MBH0776424.1 PaaI family thioesterase [Nocardia bovistercoris]